MSSRLILAAAICVTGLLYYREYAERPNLDSNHSRTIKIEERPPESTVRQVKNQKRGQTGFSHGYAYAEENELDEIGACSNSNPDFVRGCIEFVLTNQSLPKN